MLHTTADYYNLLAVIKMTTPNVRSGNVYYYYNYHKQYKDYREDKIFTLNSSAV